MLLLALLLSINLSNRTHRPSRLLDGLAMTCYYHSHIAPVAQWIEHRSSKPVVVGSNPAGRAHYMQAPMLN